jgi:hypothetical protein
MGLRIELLSKQVQNALKCRTRASKAKQRVRVRFKFQSPFRAITARFRAILKDERQNPPQEQKPFESKV